jgi:4-alpha-glucanotransferase
LYLSASPAPTGSLEGVVLSSQVTTVVEVHGFGEMASHVDVIGPLGIDYTKFKLGDDLPEDYADDDPVFTKAERRGGILFHPSSLPGPNGIGELGEEAFKFLDWLQATGCTVWQVLPLVPPGRKSGEDGSPYAGADANCGNTLLISLQELVKDGLLRESDLPAPVPVGRVDFDAVAMVKDPLIAKAAENLVNSASPLREELGKFRKDPRISSWLEEAALFAAIDNAIDAQSWWEWPEELRDRHPGALEAARKQHQSFITEFIAEQFLFQRQWQAVHRHANALGIRVVGDMPIYVGGHSGDVWANRRMFELDPKTGAPAMVSGVPPDLFSNEGQLWGSPLYNWKEMAKDNYSWWASRMRRAFELYDEFRIDHFRGLAETAMNGKWIVGPGVDFFAAIREAVGKVDIIAEDLGVLTADVLNLRKRIRAPGMSVLQFAFGGDSLNPHLPHNHEVDQVVYTGTHDNDTVVGWWTKIDNAERELVRLYLRFKGDKDVHWELIRCAISSVALTAIIPMQDVLGLGDDARMNKPATTAGNWGWRIGESGIFSELETEKEQLQECLKLFNRYPRHLVEKEKLAEVAEGVAANGK